MMKPENRKRQGGISLDPAVWAGIQKLAEADSRPFSSFVNIVLRNFLEKHAEKKLMKRQIKE